MGLILVLAFAVRAGAAVWWQQRLGDTPFAFGDSLSYWTMTRNLVTDGDFQYGSTESRMFRVPGYPLALAPLFLIGGPEPPVLAARLLGAALGTAAVAGVGSVARQLFTPAIGLVAAAGATLYPGAIGMSVFVLSEALFCPLMVLHLGLWIAAWRRQTAGDRATCSRPAREETANDESDAGGRSVPAAIRWALASGVVAGLATLTRPSWLLFLPFAAVVLLVVSPRRGEHARLLLAICMGFAVAMSPWWIRNAAITGRFVPTTLQIGATLYDSFHPGATGGSDSNMEFVPGFIDAQLAADRASLAAGQTPPSTFEYRLDRRMRDAAIAWAAANPAEVVRLVGRKSWRVWSPLPNAAEMRSGLMRWAIAAGYLPILALGIVGGWRFRRRGWAYLACAMPTLYTAALHTAFVGSIRYRQPAMLMLIVLASAVAVELIGPAWRRTRGGGRLAFSDRKEPACDA
ncbi:MAG: hypothetical protein KDA38_09505 [Planctomycetales bacterium]|nr:hypothetical protein [Planctomycetales bacterium]